MIHYHGTPLTPRAALFALAGKHFCVPFSDPRDADVCQQIGQSIMFDNGAYTAFTKGKALDVAAYYAWIEPRLGHPHWAIIPDVIDGDVEAQRSLTASWPYAKALGAPVWHLALPFDYLLELADAWPRICIGSSGAYWKIGTPEWQRRVDQAFDALARRHRHLPWVHMLRGMDLAGDRWPFASVDSVNVARNYKDAKTDPEYMARRIDGRQSPVVWYPSPEQTGLFAA